MSAKIKMHFKVYQHDNVILFVFKNEEDAQKAIGTLRMKKLLSKIKGRNLQQEMKLRNQIGA